MYSVYGIYRKIPNYRYTEFHLPPALDLSLKDDQSETDDSNCSMSDSTDSS